MFFCKRKNKERVPDYFELVDHFEDVFRSLCVDYAFLEEFLSRESLLGLTDPSDAQQAAHNVFWTYRDSLYLGIAKLVDGVEGALSLKKFKEYYSRIPRWHEPQYRKEFRKWTKAFDKWEGGTGRATISIYRDENLGHNLPQGTGKKRESLRPYKGFEGNSAGRYLSTEGDMLNVCKEGALLLVWLVKLCGRDGGSTVNYYGFKGAAEEDLKKEIRKCRRFHAALLDLI